MNALPTPGPSPALLVVGHGTRSDLGVTGFTGFVDRLRRALAPAVPAVEGGFIELSRPPVWDAAAALVAAGHTDVVAVPLVLVAAGHGKGDIPAALKREEARFPGLRHRYGRVLGPHPLLLDALQARIDDALAGDPRDGTHVVLVGRGSSDPDANAEVCKVARLLWEGRGYGDVHPSFISLARPSVPEAIDRARRLGARRIVVAPYFLFDGVLPQRIVAQAHDAATDHSCLDVRVAGLLGDSDELLTLVRRRYTEAITGDIRMNCDTCLYRVALPGHEHRVGAPQRPHHHPDDGHEHAHGQGLHHPH